MSAKRLSWFWVVLAGLPAARAWADPPQAGEIIFNELMIAPALSSGSDSHEWIEVYSRATEVRSLEGCILKEGTSGTCTIDGQTVSGHCFTLTASAGVLDVAPGGYALFALNGTSQIDTCADPVTLDYSTLSLNNSGAETLELLCDLGSGHVSVASITYQWDKTDGAATAHSWMLNQAYLDSGDATETANWCVAPDGEGAQSCTFTTDATYTEYGTPGAVNTCPAPVPPQLHPAPGEVIFSELEIWPTSNSSSPEWIELHVVSVPDEGTPDLNGCQLRVMDCTAASLSDQACLEQASPTFSSTVTLDPTGGSYPLSQDADVLLVGNTANTCVAYDPLDETHCLVYGDLAYSSSFALAGTNTRLLELACADPEGAMRPIDRVIFRGEDVSAQCKQSSDRCSWELRNESFDADLNDDPLNWGAAPPQSAYVPSFSNGAPLEAYGDPGTMNQVPPRTYTSPVDPGDIVLTELAIWPSDSTSSPDWIELDVLVPPERDAYDLSSCVLRALTCPEGAEGCVDLTVVESSGDATDDEVTWSSSSAISPVGDDLLVTGAGRLLVGSSSSKQCVATDAEDACVTSVFGTFSSSVGLSSTNTHLLELACQDADGVLVSVDRVLYDKSWVDPVCQLDSLRCSWELRPEGSIDAVLQTFNDSPVSWTAGSTDYLAVGGVMAKGTPGADNTVEALETVAGYPGEGDVAFSELMIDPAKSTPEWLELQGARDGTDGAPFELAGCRLMVAGEDEIGQCTPDAPGSCKVYQVPTTLSFSIAAGERRLLENGDACLSYGENPPAENSEGTCLIPADLHYDTISFTVSGPEAISLWCPLAEATGWVLVDELRYDWSEIDDQCPTETSDELTACSLSVHQDYVTAEYNDDSFYRCVSPETATYYDLEGNINTGTPGEENQCPALPRVPAEGDVLITELMVKPVGTDDATGAFANEWFELYNAGSETWDLRTCSFVLGPQLEDGTLDEEDAKAYPQAANPVTLEPGRYQVWAEGGCLFGYDGSCGEPGADTPVDDVYPADASFDGLSFPNSEPRVFQLRCQGPGGVVTTVDSVSFDGAWIEDGHSWQAHPEKLDDLENDDPENWCEASYQLQFWQSTQGCNYGTPGAKNDCPAPPLYEGPVPSCRCDAGASSESGAGRGALCLLLLMGVSWTRRRRR